MNCEDVRPALAGDDSAEHRQAERHAGSCAACRVLLDDHREQMIDLRNRIDAWKRATDIAPTRLHGSIQAAIARPSRMGRDRSRTWLAAAAAVVLMIVGWATLGPAGLRGEVDPGEAALLEAEAARVRYARTIADLERVALPILARAADPGLPPAQAAMLGNYRDRLTHLDGVIDEVRGFLEQHPGHAGGSTVLLAAYTEKQQVLGQLLALNLGGQS